MQPLLHRMGNGESTEPLRRSFKTLKMTYKRIAAYAVHCLTVSGIVPAALAVMEIASPTCDPRTVFLWLLLATVIDAVDGPLARRFHVKHFAPNIDGRTIDDLLDYLTFAFIPLLLIWRMEWLPSGFGWTVMFAMGASLFGFSHKEAKDEANGFFRGFPSYWNAFALYAGVFTAMASPWLTAIAMWGLTVLTVAPVWMIYPNLAPRKWKPSIMIGAILWAVTMLAILWDYPHPLVWLLAMSLAYPLFYAILSWQLRLRIAGKRST
ncbi:Phosphatidylcholine synthase [Roseimaritima multifibrata]|uniref:Phosphatidylcholine synthase n=2 Tax=Roseimaritima multifibrata TaxID=1930274 RepID=A0A517MJP5_9BACT|nr:Phosphatidylcholine synthase [Roseimaritima multifibrata]